MLLSDHPDLVPLHDQIRRLWRREPAVEGPERTAVLLRLHEIKNRLHDLSVQWRAGLLDDDSIRTKADHAAGELRRLRVHWA